jgi:hypothetical protein
MPDQLSALYSEFLDGGYDCVDRVILNAYFSMGQSGEVFACGGVSCTVPTRTWMTTT